MNEGETVVDAAVKQNPAMAPITDDPALPRVLLIGDSISIAYTVPVRERLKGVANVHRAPVNCQSTRTGLSGTHPGGAWLGDKKWDVIHFNFGIWDAKIDPKTGLPATSREDYVKNLQEIAQRLQSTGAKVVFATATPIPDILTMEKVAAPLEPRARFFVPLPERNAAAAKAMEAMGVSVDDLYAVIYPDREKFWRPKDLHFSPAGSEVLADAVAASIKARLPQP